MARVGPMIVVAFVAAAVPLEATPLFPLEASLRAADPLLVTGSVLADPGPSDSAVGDLLIDRAGPNPGPLMEAGGVRLTIRRWEAGPIGDYEVMGRGGTPESFSVTEASLTVEGGNGAPQIRWYGAPTAVPEMHVRFEAPLCLVQDAPDGVRLFPNDVDAVSGTSRVASSPSAEQLEAGCRVQSIDVNEAASTLVYGLDLRLASRESNRLIRTGTFEEPDPSGLPITRTVTQILEVAHDGKPVRFDVDSPGHLRLYAHAFAAAGQLRAGPAEGWLTWGALSQEGSVEPFEADGAYRLSWSPERFVAVSGNSVTPPPDAATENAFVSPLASTWMGVAAGGTLLGLLAWRVWPLFTKLLPDGLQSHPRRRRIMEFVRSQPGVQANTVARSLGLGWANLFHHIDHLRRGGRLAVRRYGGRTALFPANAGLRGREEQLFLLRQPAFQRLHEALRVRAGLGQDELSRELQLSQARVSRSLARLLGAGLVRKEKAGRRLRYFAVDGATR